MSQRGRRGGGGGKREGELITKTTFQTGGGLVREEGLIERRQALNRAFTVIYSSCLKEFVDLVIGGPWVRIITESIFFLFCPAVVTNECNIFVFLFSKSCAVPKNITLDWTSGRQLISSLWRKSTTLTLWLVSHLHNPTKI